MKTRLALIGCIIETEGPWQRAKGNEFALVIDRLGEGDRIEMQIEIGDVRDTAYFDVPGTFPLPWKRIERYRVNKRAGSAPASTTVEIGLNGAP